MDDIDVFKGIGGTETGTVEEMREGGEGEGEKDIPNQRPENDLQNIVDQIQKMPSQHHHEFLRILLEHKVTYTENSSGTLVNLTYLPENIIQAISNHIRYVKETIQSQCDYDEYLEQVRENIILTRDTNNNDDDDKLIEDTPAAIDNANTKPKEEELPLTLPLPPQPSRPPPVSIPEPEKVIPKRRGRKPKVKKET